MQLRYIYFDIPFWRPEIGRLALHLGQIPFEDERPSIADFRARQAAGEFPSGQLPVLDVDGRRYSQSLAIARYCGKLAGLYPTEDALGALGIDEVLETAAQISDLFVPTWNEADPERKAAARAAISDALKVWMERLERRLEANGGVWFVGESFSLADLAIWRLIGWLTNGSLDGIPTTLIDGHVSLVGHQRRVEEIQGVRAYMDARYTGWRSAALG